MKRAEAFRVRERLYALADSADAETCGTALIALPPLNGNPEIDAARLAARALKLAEDASQPQGLRLTAIQAAAAMARIWLARESSASMRAVAIGVLGKHSAPSDRARIEPFLKNPDPRLSGAARFALKGGGQESYRDKRTNRLAPE